MCSVLVCVVLAELGHFVCTVAVCSVSVVCFVRLVEVCLSLMFAKSKCVGLLVCVGEPSVRGWVRWVSTCWFGFTYAGRIGVLVCLGLVVSVCVRFACRTFGVEGGECSVGGVGVCRAGRGKTSSAQGRGV